MLGLAVGDQPVGELVGSDVVGSVVGKAEDKCVGDAVGVEVVGEPVGDDVGSELVGEAVGDTVGTEVEGARVGNAEGDTVGRPVGLAVGTQAPQRAGQSWARPKLPGRSVPSSLKHSSSRKMTQNSGSGVVPQLPVGPTLGVPVGTEDAGEDDGDAVGLLVGR